MLRLPSRLGWGLDGWQIKMTAVLFMTIDHLGAYGFQIPLIGTYESTLRLLGRIAMPLFLFMVTESVKHTRSRPRFLLRLYLGAVWSGLFVAVTNFLFHDTIGMFASSNIFFTYFYVTLYIILVEQILAGIRRRDMKKVIMGIAGIAATGIPLILLLLLDQVNIMDYGASLQVAFLFQDVVCSFLASPIHVEYTILFVIMGVVMYFGKDKYQKAAVLAAFSILCYLGGKVPAIYGSEFGFVVGYPQYYMILAVPIILLYNGQKGRGDKYFFYLYYPIHRYVISVAVYIYQCICGA